MEKIKIHTDEVSETRNGMFRENQISELRKMTNKEINRLDQSFAEHISIKKDAGGYRITQGSHRVEAIRRNGGGMIEALIF